MPETFSTVTLRCAVCGGPIKAKANLEKAAGGHVFLNVDPCPQCLEDEAQRASGVLHMVARLDRFGLKAGELESALADTIQRKREEQSAKESEAADA